MKKLLILLILLMGYIFYLTNYVVAAEKQPPKVINISFHTTGDWRLTKEEDEDINKFIKYLQENEISNEWKTNTYQHKLSSKASLAMSSIDVGRDKEIKELYQKSGLKEKDYKLLNLILREKILGKQRYNILVEIFRNKLKKEIKSEQEQAVRFLTQGLYEYRVADEIIIEVMNKTKDPNTCFIGAEGLSYIGDNRAEGIFLEVLKTENYDFAIDALEGMDRLNWEREKLEEQARRFVEKAQDYSVKANALMLIENFEDDINIQVVEKIIKNVDFYHLPKAETLNTIKLSLDETGKKEFLYEIACETIRKNFVQFEHDRELIDTILLNIKSENTNVSRASISVINWAITRLSLLKTEEVFKVLANGLQSKDHMVKTAALSAIRRYSKEKKIEIADDVLVLLKESEDSTNALTVGTILFFYNTYGINFGQPNRDNISLIKEKIIDFFEKKKSI